MYGIIYLNLEWMKIECLNEKFVLNGFVMNEPFGNEFVMECNELICNVRCMWSYLVSPWMRNGSWIWKWKRLKRKMIHGKKLKWAWLKVVRISKGYDLKDEFGYMVDFGPLIDQKVNSCKIGVFSYGMLNTYCDTSWNIPCYEPNQMNTNQATCHDHTKLWMNPN